MNPEEFETFRKKHIQNLKNCISKSDHSSVTSSDYSRARAIRQVLDNQESIMAALVFLLEDKI